MASFKKNKIYKISIFCDLPAQPDCNGSELPAQPDNIGSTGDEAEQNPCSAPPSKGLYR